MADNVTVLTEDGPIDISTDDLGAFQVQRMKIQHGVNGVAVDASSVDPLPVTAVLPELYDEGDVDAVIKGFAILWEDSGNALVPVNVTKPLPVSTVPSAFGTDSVESMIGVRTSGGASMHSIIGAASQNPTVVKSSAGQIYAIQAFNIAATPVYLKLYDKSTSPVSTDTPLKRLLIPGNSGGAGFIHQFAGGLSFTAGISYRLVGGIADNDTTNVVASQQLINVDYK